MRALGVLLTAVSLRTPRVFLTNISPVEHSRLIWRAYSIHNKLNRTSNLTRMRKRKSTITKKFNTETYTKRLSSSTTFQNRLSCLEQIHASKTLIMNSKSDNLRWIWTRIAAISQLTRRWRDGIVLVSKRAADSLHSRRETYCPVTTTSKGIRDARNTILSNPIIASHFLVLAFPPYSSRRGSF